MLCIERYDSPVENFRGGRESKEAFRWKVQILVTMTGVSHWRPLLHAARRTSSEFFSRKKLSWAYSASM